LKFKGGYQDQGETGVTARRVQADIRIHIKCTIIKRVQKKVSCMKTIGVRALRENPGVLSQCAERGELILVTNRNNPISLSVPFSDELLQSGIGVSMAVKLFEGGILPLPKSAKLAKMPIEEFLLKLAALDVIVVDQPTKELKSDLGAIR
jgi:predicted HTH domain antitoxin